VEEIWSAARSGDDAGANPARSDNLESLSEGRGALAQEDRGNRPPVRRAAVRLAPPASGDRDRRHSVGVADLLLIRGTVARSSHAGHREYK